MIFVDTSFGSHSGTDVMAIMTRRQLFPHHAGTQLATTSHVQGETWTYLRRRAGHNAAMDFLDALEASPRVRVVQVSEPVEERALAWLRRHDERHYSFVDATSFETMRNLRIRDALAFDGDFTAARFNELRL